jgi:hypothetical protein
MNNIELDLAVSQLVKTERKITRQILDLIVLAEKQRLPAERGFRNTHDWLIRGHGYSGSAANRRVQAARLLNVVPEVASKVEDGSLNLTTLWQTQKTINAQQAASGQKVTLEEKREALHSIENETSEGAERVLNALFPDGVQSGEKTTHKRDGGLRIFIEVTDEEAKEIQRSRELLSQSTTSSHGALYARLCKEYNDRKDPLRKAAAPGRGDVIRKANGACVFKDPVTGRVCGSRFNTQQDHIIPKAKGGSDEPENMRCLCRRHNQLMAEKEFGREFMENKRRRSDSGTRHRST